MTSAQRLLGVGGQNVGAEELFSFSGSAGCTMLQKLLGRQEGTVQSLELLISADQRPKYHWSCLRGLILVNCLSFLSISSL